LKIPIFSLLSAPIFLVLTREFMNHKGTENTKRREENFNFIVSNYTLCSANFMAKENEY
jgi:hypothetical protein